MEKRNAMTEEETERLVRELVMSRIVNSLPYHNLTHSDEEKVHIIICSTYKAALNLSRFTATEKNGPLQHHSRNK